MLKFIKKYRPLAIGATVVVLFGTAVILAFQATSGLPWSDHTYVKAAFANIGGLRVDDDVRIARSRIGRVSEVRLERGTPTVTLQLDSGYKVYRNATLKVGGNDAAAVQDRSPLGQQFVELDPGTPDAGPFPADGVIPADRTESSRQLSDLFEVFDPATRQALGSTVRETGGGLAGHSRDLHDFLQAGPSELPDLGTVSRALSANNGADTAAVLHAANQLSNRFAGREGQISSLVTQLRSTTDALGVDRGKPLGDTIDEAPQTLRTAREALGHLQRPLNNLGNAAATLQPGAQALGQATPDIRGALREAPTPLEKVPGVARDADPALRSLTATVRDARPLAPRAAQTLASANPLLSTLAPYSPEIGTFFDNWASALAHGDKGGRYLRVTLMLNTQSVDGQLNVRDPQVQRNPYPVPGQAVQDGKGPLIPSGGGDR